MASISIAFNRTRLRRPACGTNCTFRTTRQSPASSRHCGPKRITCYSSKPPRWCARKRPDARFLIVGDGPERPAIELGIQRFRLGECVHLLGSRSDIPDVLSACDAFMLTSHNEANPVSILEAMSVGLPVVSTNVGSVCESVEHGVTGFLAQPGNACDLADSLLTIFNKADLAAQLGAAGRQTVVDRWSLDAMVRGYEDLLTGIFAAKHGERGA